MNRAGTPSPFWAGKGWTVLTLKDPAVMDRLLPEKSQAYRRLDVSVLHSLVLESFCASTGRTWQTRRT